MAKRRPSGDGMVRKRDDGRWEGRIVVGHKENGDSIFHYGYAPTQKELSAKLRQHIDSYQKADLTEQSRMTLSKWLDQWLESMVDTLRPNTLRNCRSYIENHIRPSLGDKQLARLTSKDIQRFYEKLGCSLASGTVRRIHTTLHGTLKAAQQAHLIASNPTEQVITPKFSYGAKQILTDGQLDVFMKVIAEDKIWCDFFYTELTTGLRLGEICGLKWKDFDEVSGTLKICRTVYREDGGSLTAGDTKTSAGTRNIVLPPSTVSLLSKRKASALTEWIFPNPLKSEQPADPSSAYRQLKVLLKQAGLPSIRFHDLRHTFATNALEHGMDIKTLSAVIGHVSSATTLNVYAHVTDEMRQSAATKIDRAIARVDLSRNRRSRKSLPGPPLRPSKESTANRERAASRRSATTYGRGGTSRRSKEAYGPEYLRPPTEAECEEKLVQLIIQMKEVIASQYTQVKAG